MKEVRYNLLITLFSIALVLLNIVGFLIHDQAFPENTLMVNAWNYFDSSVFTFVTGTLTFPIIIMFLESKFKIIEAAREKRKQEIEAIKQNQINKRREILATIDNDWNHLYEYVNQLKYFVVNKADESDNMKRLSEIQIGIINSVLDWDKNINELYYYYPRLKDLEPVYLYFLNLYVTVSTSMANYMKAKIHDVKYIEDLQEAYEVITGTTKNIWYGDFINILRLKNSRIELLEIDSNEVKEIDQKIEMHAKNLKVTAKFLMGVELKSNNVFKNIQSNPSENFQTLIAEYKEYIKTAEQYNIYGFGKIDDLEKEYYATEASEMFRKLNILYSEESIFDMAEQLGFFTFLLRLSQPIEDAKAME